MEEALRRELAEVARTLHARGWVANHDGNVTARLGEGRFLATPTAVSKRVIAPESLLVVDEAGTVLAGERKLFSEFSLHRACYRARPEAWCVLHAHPPQATAWAVAGRAFFDPPFMAEPVVSLGANIPLLPYAAPGGPTAALELAIAEVDAVLLESHGVLAIGPDLETALLRLELVEHLAGIALHALALGGARPIPAADVARLVEARTKAGLGPGPRAAAGGSQGPPRPDVPALVRDALRRLG
jgi:L-fuculose-phosphate aldolase